MSKQLGLDTKRPSSLDPKRPSSLDPKRPSSLDPKRVLSKVIERGIWILPVQLGVFAAAGVLAFLLRFDFNIPRRYVLQLVVALCVWAVTKLFAFRWLHLHRGWHLLSLHSLMKLAAGNVLGSIAGAAIILAISPVGFPRSIYLLDLLVCFVFTGGMRVFARIVADAVKYRVSPGERKLTLIYGAGAAGELLLREIHQNAALPYDVLGFIDDDATKKGLSIQGTMVLGPGSNLMQVATRRRIEMVLIAMPSASGAQLTEVLRFCHQARVSCKTVPSLAEIIEENGLARQIREVAVEDLLGRTTVRLDHDQISAKIIGNTVLVTGAAGSIGSELCRQIAGFNPSAIVGFEIAETALFHLDREMRQSFPGVRFYPEIGSIQNKQRLAEVLEQYRPSIVYHAAAYKHVPLMEDHVFEAVENNIFGTWNVALAAAHYEVEEFVMISSDKAVRPTNVMGATKRVAELLILALQNGGTKFVSVRFGNVLGSNGSVIPIFKQQIAVGGPVTVTHPDMQRYFMTIPEASQLVLQASTMGSGGEIFVLDMGTPVKIVDLARNLILLSGFRPDDDIAIEFTGVRPGEKLYEELNSLNEDTLPTPHEKIKIFAGNGVPSGGMEFYLEKLRDICAQRDVSGLVLTLKDLIPEYNPNAHLLSRAFAGSSTTRQTTTGDLLALSRIFANSGEAHSRPSITPSSSIPIRATEPAQG